MDQVRKDRNHGDCDDSDFPHFVTCVRVAVSFIE